MKIILRVSLIGIISLIFVGGFFSLSKFSPKGGAIEQQQGKVNLDQPIKIKFGMWEAKTDIKFWTEKVRDYSKIKPNVTVEVETIPDNSGQYLKVRLAANDLPDIFYLKPDDLLTYKAVLLPLDGLTAAKNNKYPARLDHSILGLPLVSFSEYVYYHPSIFQEAGVEIPQTMDEFMDVMMKIKAHGKYIPIAIGGKENWTFYPFTEFGPPLLSKNENYLSSIAQTKRPFGKGSPFEKAAVMIKKIAENELAGPDALNIGVDQATLLFQNNKAAMLALGQWYLRDHLSKMKDDKDLDAFTLPWRETTSERLQAITMPDQYMAINKNSKNTEEVKAFLEWVFSRDVYQVYINYSQNSSTVINIESFLPFFNNVQEKHPFEPFMYLGIDEKFEKVKNAIQFDEKKAAQEIFSGAEVADIQEKLNDDWEIAVEALR
ncbi:extracellular solute-binding protein [Paenibacillus sp. FSL H8-0261]|uniref:ABC transporter substrate-binding protein n=1 Tax=Paenibacillus sp. FSL H8-0261 TaxID=2921381 RepID=UPI0032474111